MIKYIGIGLAGLALVGCTQAAPAPAPAPTVTVTAAPTVAPAPVPNLYQEAMQESWDAMSYADQENVCLVYNSWPAEAWDAFNEGAEGLVPRSEFDKFFSSKCASY